MFSQQHSKKGLSHFWLAASIFNADYKPQADIARRMGGIISSASSVERLFSSYGLTWSRLRNRLRSTIVKQVTFIRQRQLAEEAKEAHKEAVTAAAAAAAANDVDLYVSSDLHEESELELEDSLFESD